MEDWIGREELARAAAICGREWSWVETQMKAGLIPYGKRKNTESIGEKFYYPPETFRQVEAIGRLRAIGCRGHGLKFGLWWMGYCAFDESVRSFIKRCFLKTKEFAQESVQRRQKLRAGNRGQNKQFKDGVSDFSEKDIFAEDLEKLAKIKKQLMKLMDYLDPGHGLEWRVLEKIVLGWAASYFDIPPYELQLFEKEKSRVNKLLENYLVNKKKDKLNFFQKVASKIAAKITNGLMFRLIVNQIDRADAKRFDFAKREIKSDPEFRRFIIALRDFLIELNHVVKDRRKVRMGEMRYPAIYSRANTVMLITILLSFVETEIS